MHTQSHEPTNPHGRQRAKPPYSFGAGVTSALCLSPPTNTHLQRAHLAWQQHTTNGEKTQNCQEGKILRNCRRLNTRCMGRQLARVQTGEAHVASGIKRRLLPTRSAIRCDVTGAFSDVTPRNLPQRPSRLPSTPNDGSDPAHTHWSRLTLETTSTCSRRRPQCIHPKRPMVTFWSTFAHSTSPKYPAGQQTGPVNYGMWLGLSGSGQTN